MKYYGYYTKAAKAAIKSSRNGIYCQVAEDGYIYVQNGFFIFKMNPRDYDEFVRPVTMCEPGDWIIDNTGKRENHSGFNAVKFFADAVADVDETEPLQRCPLVFQPDAKAPEQTAFYSVDRRFAAFYNSQYANAIIGYSIRTNGALKPAVAYIGDDPIAVIMPIKSEASAVRAVAAYFTAETAEQTANNTEIENLRAELAYAQKSIVDAERRADEYADAARRAEEHAAHLAAELDRLRNSQTAEKTEQHDEPNDEREKLIDRLATLKGCTIKVNGEKTAAPVLWVFGETRPHRETLKAAGLRWSPEKSGWWLKLTA